MFDRELTGTAAAMVARGKVILAIDGASGTLEQRFGQGGERATAHFEAMNAGKAKLPSPLSISYGRAVQAPALKAWKGQPSSIAAAQKAHFQRAILNRRPILATIKWK